MEQHRRINLAYILNKSDDLLSPVPSVVRIYHVHPVVMTPEEVCSFVQGMTIVGIKNLDMTDVKVKFNRPYHEYEFVHEYGLTEMFQRVYEEHLSAKRHQTKSRQEGESSGGIGNPKAEDDENEVHTAPTGSVQFYWKAGYAGGDTITFLYRKAIDTIPSARMSGAAPLLVDRPPSHRETDQEDHTADAESPSVGLSSTTETEQETSTSDVALPVPSQSPAVHTEQETSAPQAIVVDKEDDNEDRRTVIINDEFLHLIREDDDATTVVNLEERYGMIKNGDDHEEFM